MSALSIKGVSPAGYVKATTGGLIAGLGAIGTGLADGQLTAAEVVGAIVVGLTAFAAVFGVTNEGQSQGTAEGRDPANL